MNIRISFIDLNDPLIRLHKINKNIVLFRGRENIRNKGASFCQVSKNNSWYFLINSTIIGNQKWNGAAPSFRKIAKFITL